jgi:choline dehydrogenase-like flavoprotein
MIRAVAVVPSTSPLCAKRAELPDAFIEAAMAEGFPRNPDYNNGYQEGFGYFQATQKNGRRWSNRYDC